jgi:hypothetical protein
MEIQRIYQENGTRYLRDDKNILYCSEMLLFKRKVALLVVKINFWRQKARMPRKKTET